MAQLPGHTTPISADEWGAQIARFRNSVEMFRAAMHKSREVQAGLLRLRQPLRIDLGSDDGDRNESAAGKNGRSLSRREVQVAELVARGLRNRDIGRELVLEEGTVANHVRRIRLKLGLRSRAQIAAWYVMEYGDPAAHHAQVLLTV